MSETSNKEQTTPQSNNNNYTQIFENMSEMFQVIELIYEDDKVIDYYFRQVNPAFEKLVGMSSEQILGKRAKDLFGVVEDHWLEVYKKIDSTEETITAENYGKEFDKYYKIKGWKIEEHVVAVIFSDITNITNAKLVEVALKENESRYSHFHNASHDQIYSYDLENRFTMANKVLCENLNLKAEELMGKSYRELGFPDENCKLWDEMHSQVYAEGSLVKTVSTPMPDGTTQYFEVNLFVINDNSDKVIGIGGINRNITENKLAEIELIEAKEKIEESENRFRAIFENAPILINSFDENGHCLFWNQQSVKTLGWTIDEINEQESAMDLFYPDPVTCEEVIQSVTLDPDGCFREWRPVTKDGITLSTMWANFTLPNGQVFSMGYDITNRREAEEALKQMALFPELNSAPVMSFGEDGSIISSNPAANNIIGNPASLGKKISSALPCFRDVDFSNCISNDTLIKRECQIKDRIYQFIIQGIPKFNIGHVYGTDITERVQAEEEKESMNFEINKLQKLESIGMLAGGIAHDFNNMLCGIFGYIEIAKAASNQSSVIDQLQNALSVMGRAQDLTSQLLTFSKGGDPVRLVQPISSFINEIIQFALSGSNVISNLSIEDSLWLCSFDRNQISQVIDNLIINAKQAMPDGGSITVKATNSNISNSYSLALSAGEYIKITFQDCGCGITPDTMEHIFDPFFTTKQLGNGLGLATSYSIISHHGGTIEVTSEVGVGTCFTIYLPATDEEEVQVQKISNSDHKGIGKIIVVDDDPTILRIYDYMLTSLGYTPILLQSGEDTINYFESKENSPTEIVAMIFDLTIPGGIGGEITIMLLRKAGISIPSFVSSGYSDDPVMSKPQEYGFLGSISKPFKKTDLMEMLDECL
jgi:PAS domain S-box-containing protein